MSSHVDVSPLQEIALVAGREVKKNLRSWKGLALGGLTVGGGGGLMALLLSQIHKAELKAPPEMVTTMRANGLMMYAHGDREIAKSLMEAPSGVLVLLLITIMLTPAYMALTGFDLVSSDLQHRAVRYWTVRVRRASYLLGKFLGLWAVAAAVVFLLHLVVWILMIARGDAPAAATMTWGLRLYAAWLPVAAAWAAACVLIGGLVSRPFFALVAILFVVFALWAVANIGDTFFGIEASMYLWPNEYLNLLVSPGAKQIAAGAGLSAAFAATMMALSVVLFSRRDV